MTCNHVSVGFQAILPVLGTAAMTSISVYRLKLLVLWMPIECVQTGAEAPHSDRYKRDSVLASWQ